MDSGRTKQLTQLFETKQVKTPHPKKPAKKTTPLRPVRPHKEKSIAPKKNIQKTNTTLTQKTTVKTSPSNLKEQAIKAIQNDDAEKLRSLIFGGLNINSSVTGTQTLLQLANECDSAQSCILLINLGATIPPNYTQNKSSELLELRREGNKKSIQKLNLQLQNREESDGSTVEKTMGFNNLVIQNDTEFFLQAMSNQLAKDLHQTRTSTPSLHYSLAESPRHSSMIQYACENPSPSSRKEVSQTIDSFFKKGPTPPPCLHLSGFRTFNHSINLVLQPSTTPGLTTLFVCNRGLKPENTESVVIRTVKTNQLPDLLLQLSDVKEIKGDSQRAVETYYKTIEKGSQPPPKNFKVTEKDFKFQNQLASNNCGRASTSAGLRVMCTLYDLDNAKYYEKTRKTKSSGAFSTYKKLNSQLLAKLNQGREPKKNYKDISQRLDQLERMVAKSPENITSKVRDWYNQNLTVTGPSTRKRINYLIRLKKICDTGMTKPSTELEKTKAQIKERTDQYKKISQSIESMNKKREGLEKKLHEYVKKGLAEFSNGSFSIKSSSIEQEFVTTIKELNTCVYEINQTANKVNQTAREINTLNQKEGRVLQAYNEVIELSNYLDDRIQELQR